MRTFGILPTEFWKDEQLQSLPVPTRLIAAYLYSSPHTNSIGCFRLPLSYISEDLHIQQRFVVKAVKELTAILFLQFDPPSKYFAITDFISARAKKWLANPNNYIAATRELEEIPDSVPFKSEIRRQLIEIKRPGSNGDTNNVLTPSQRRIHYYQEEGEGKEDGDNHRDYQEDAQSAQAPLKSASPDSSLSSFTPLPRSLSFPLRHGAAFDVDSRMMDSWQVRFPRILVPVRLLKHIQWFQNNPHKRMNREGTEKAILKFLAEDDAEAARNTKPP